MSVTVAQIRSGLQTRLATITDLQVMPYALSNPSPPAAYIFPAETQYDQTFNRGTDLWTFTVQIVVSAQVDTGSQIQLDAFLAPSGSGSVKTAIEADKTLGGVVQTLHVSSVSGYRFYGTEPPVLGAEWTVDIYAPGS